MENNKRRLFVKDGKGMAAGSFFLMMCFTGGAHAALSGLPEGYPRFFTENNATVNYDYVKNGTSTLKFSTSKNTNWQSSMDSQSIESVKNSLFKVNVKLNASNKSDPGVLKGSSIEVWGGIGSLAANTTQKPSNNLLYSANIVDLFWTTGKDGIIEFVQDGGSMKGQVCDLGYCSYANEALHFQFKDFDGNWGRDFSKSASAVATVPVPSAVWLMGSALLGLLKVGRRKAAL